MPIDAADALVVQIDANIASFQAQLDRARAELSRFANTAAAPVANAASNIDKAAVKSVTGLNRLNNAMVSLVRETTGASPVVARFGDVIGTMALGSAMMIPVLLGVSGLALAIARITKESREAKKAIDEMRDSATKIAERRRVSSEAEVFRAAVQSAKDLTAARERLAELRTTVPTGPIAPEDLLGASLAAKRVAEAEDEVARLTQQFALLKAEIGDIAQNSFDNLAKASEKAANDAAAEWKRALQEIEESARQRIGFTPEGIQRPVSAETLGFEVIIPAAKDAANALAQLPETMKKLASQLGLVPVGSTTPPPDGFVKGLQKQVGQLFDPKLIASGLAVNFISNMAARALPVLGDMAKAILGLGDAARVAARAAQRAINDIRDSITLISGSDFEKNIVRVREELTRRIADAFNSGALRGGLITQIRPEALRNADTLEEFVAQLRSWQQLVEEGSAQWEFFNELIKLAGVLWEDFNNQISQITDSLRNIPQGYKIALAQFNATTPSPALAGAVGANLTVTVRAEPEGIFRTVERRAVQVKRTGGVLAWELDV